MMINNTATTAELVRNATVQAHGSTEKALIKHIKIIRSPEQYASLLYCMYGYFAPMEQQMEPFIRTLLDDHQQRRKASRLLDDLQILGFPPPQQTAGDLPAMNCPVEALACLYVLEGATLGGTVIKKIISAQCPSIPGKAFSFFSGYEDRNSSMWQSFLATFNNAVTTGPDTRLAINAASDCFTRFENWINSFYTLSNGGLQ